MLVLNKITVAVDLSEPSRGSLAYAAELAGRLGAELTVLHVHKPIHPYDALQSASRGSTGIAATEEALEAWRLEADRLRGAPVRAKLLFGDAAEELVRHAGLGACDLLVVGTRGRSLLPRLVLGSVAERVIRESACPVLVAHDRGALERADEAAEIAQYR